MSGLVRLKRGAGAGCTIPSISMKVPRALLCRWCGASAIDRTGATQASEPSRSAHHSAAVRVASRAAIVVLIAGQLAGLPADGRVAGSISIKR